MIKFYAKSGQTIKELETYSPKCWINIAEPFNQEELERLSSQLDIPLDFLTDSLDIDERSRYEKEDDTRLIVINTPIRNTYHEENEAIYITVPIGIILTPKNVITITSFENPILKKIINNSSRNIDPANEQHFVLRIMEQNVFRYLSCLKKLNLQRNLIEKELYDSYSNKELKQLTSIEKSLVYMVTALSTNELLKMKMKRSDFLNINKDEDKLDLFEDILIDNSQALEMANTYTKVLASTMEASAAIISNNLNIIIHRLTLVTIILMVPTLVASFFGMNTPSGLENSRWAFYVIIVISVLLSLILAFIFRKRKLF